ncbi:uncharacterized protein J8A68_005310, partial [[Candida] subhashii]
MTKSDVKYLTSKIKSSFFKGIGEDIVTSLNVQGGFGLLNLGKQLSGRRAQYVWHTLTNVTDWNFNIFRYKLQEFVNKSADSYQASTDSILAIPWYKFLTGLTLNYQGRDISTMVDQSDIFTNTEKVYLEAWFDLIGSLRKTYTAQPSHFSHDEYRDFFGSPPSTILPPLFADLPGDFFNSRSKKFNIEAKPCVIPEGWSNLYDLDPADWVKFFKILAHGKRCYPD